MDMAPRSIPTAWAGRLALALALSAAMAAVARGADDTTLCDPTTTTCRTIDFFNNCEESVWVASQGNAIYCATDDQCETGTTCNVAANTCSCTTDQDCGEAQKCDTSQNPGLCRWATPSNGGWEITSGTTDIVYVPNKRGKSQDLSWGGRFWGRTGCPDFATCAQPGASCDSDSDCCTNAGCLGLFTCQNDTQCPTWSCTGDAECGAGTCNLTTNTCSTCVSGSCACRNDADCQDGGKCTNGSCGGACGANGTACATGDCLGQLECSGGGQPPFTIAEIVMMWTRRKNPNGVDTYDVSQVEGFNLPIEVAPTKNIHRREKAQGAVPWCGRPGCADGTECASLNTACPFDPTGYPSCLCSWDVDASSCPATMQAVWPLACETNADCAPGNTCDQSTTPPTCTCTADADCPNSAPTCGLNANVPGKQVCGTYAGCMNPNNACATNGSLSGAGLDCPTWGTLYACSGVGSCYTIGADATCCGCPEWSPGGNTNLPILNSCQSSNSNWTTNVQPLVATFKDSCPTAYSFQYDDPTSTFHCASKSPRSPAGYTVTFCPCGSPGARPGGCPT